ncbi:type II toxin-antitoxin system RelE/ParE family toxin [Vallitalea guaymasensis]|uniref:type II toxin-antitoxin system RelE/ParE family toxin n=1 Tax=Vallitalea guaymasensis TaxID=1185412 RepID=UPI000DE218FA|nr:type II toxin-antitoxin system RelE/ParE family toxin [Vallitalea guaymasensis]
MVKWSNSAKLDLRQIYNYISTNSEFYAKKVINDIIYKSDNLNNYPSIGKEVNEFNNPLIREIYVYSYRMIYQIVSNNNVEILAIVHTKRNLKLNDDTDTIEK